MTCLGVCIIPGINADEVYNSETVTDKTPIPPPDWEALIAQIADDIMIEHTPAQILIVRAKLYDLLSHCIPPSTILKVVCARFLPGIKLIEGFRH